MKDTQNITIAILLATAAILAAMLLADYAAMDTSARADAQSIAGDYIMIAGQRSSSTDNLYIIDVAAQRINVYQGNLDRDTVDLVDRVNLERAFRE